MLEPVVTVGNKRCLGVVRDDTAVVRVAIIEENVIIRGGLVATVVELDGVELGFVGDHLGALARTDREDANTLLCG